MLVASGLAFGCRASTTRSDSKAAARCRWSTSGSSANSSARAARWAVSSWLARRSPAGWAGPRWQGRPRDWQLYAVDNWAMQTISGRRHGPPPGWNPQPRAEVNLRHERDTRAWCSTRKSSCRLGQAAGQPLTVKVADATLPLWRPLAWKVSFLPG